MPSIPGSLPLRGPAAGAGGQDFAAAMSAAGGATAPAAVSTAAAAVSAGSAGVDFTNMTRKELFDWMNERITSGEMSLDDSSGFLGMTLKLPVDADVSAFVAPDNNERVDFVQEARQRLSDARHWRDVALADRLTTTLAIMRDYQSASVGGAAAGWA